MNIKINHINKMEGHAGFMASVLNGDIKSAKLEIKEGIRLIEGILIGRHYKDMPIIAQRICGICPVVHNLTAIKSIEKAMGVKITQETKDLRKLLEWGQIIHSHALHLFFLSLADMLDIDNDLKLVEKYPEETKMAIKVREFGMEIIKVLGGRVIHPLTNEVGGFKKVPTKEEIKKLIDQGNDALKTAQELGDFFAKFKFPDFERETEYVSLENGNEYAIYEGNISSNRGLHIPVEKFENNFNELQKPQQVVKKVETKNKNSYMVGAIARINNNYGKLSPQAEHYFESLGYTIPDYNPFHNIIYQMVEVIHSIEKSIILLTLLENTNLNKALTAEYVVREGVGVAAIEAPRGMLFYHTDIDANGYIKNVNIITPTAQSLSHLENDIALYLKDILDLPEEKRTQRIRGFIRAYDPCISCAVH